MAYVHKNIALVLDSSYTISGCDPLTGFGVDDVVVDDGVVDEDVVVVDEVVVDDEDVDVDDVVGADVVEASVVVDGSGGTVVSGTSGCGQL